MDDQINSIENVTKIKEKSTKNNDEFSLMPQTTKMTTEIYNSTLANKSTESVELNVSDKLIITASDNSDDDDEGEPPKIINQTMGNKKKPRKFLDSEDDDDEDGFNVSRDKPIINKLISSSDSENEEIRNKKIHISNRPTGKIMSSSDNEESADEIKKSQKKIKKLHKKSSEIKKNVSKSSGSSSSSSSESGKEEETINIKQSLQGICDSDSNDDDYQPNIIYNDKISTDINKKSTIKPIERPPKRMSAKEAEEQMKAIQSESQRLARESNLCVPYHRPKQHSLKEFLNRRTINKPIPAMDMKKAAAAIKMSKEELIEYAKKLDERAKESQEFFKSESEEEEEKHENNEVDKEEMTPNDNIEQITNKSSETIPSVTEEIIEESEKMETFPIFSTEDILQEAKQLCNTKNNDNEASILDSQKNITQNDVAPIDTAQIPTTITTSSTITKKIEIDYNYGDEKLDLNSLPSNQKLTNLKECLLARMTTPSTKLINGPCRLKGTKDCMIDLDTGNILPAPPTAVKSGPQELFERFRKHSKKIINKTTEQSISVISTNNGFFEIENIKIKVDEDEPIIQDSKPRSTFFKLKQAFSSQLAARRKEEILRRKEESEAAKKKAKKLSNEDNEESDNDEIDDEEIGNENDGINDGNDNVNEEEHTKHPEKESINEEFVIDDNKINDKINNDDKYHEANDDNMFNSEDEDDNNALSGDDESDEENVAEESENDDDNDNENDDANNKPKSRKRIILLDDSDNENNENAENNENIENISKIPATNDEFSNDLDDDLLDIGAHKPLDLLTTTVNSPKKLFTQNIDECVTESQLYDLCSGNFATQLPGNNELMSSSQQLPTTASSPPPPEEEQPLRLNLESSEDEENDDKLFQRNLLNKKTDKHKRKIIKKLSDDEDEDDNAEKPIGNNSEDDEMLPLSLNVNENEFDDDSDSDDDRKPDEENDKCIEYDSEENEIEIVVTKKERRKKAKGFFENEAELSESEWGSADEDEQDLDKLEIELGDADKFDQDQLRSELERIHMRRLLDKDAREVKILKEMLIEDEEDTGLGRERQFKWLNVDNNLDDITAQKNNEDDDAGGVGGGDAGSDNENELEWRRMRYERESLLNKSKIDDNFGAGGLLQQELGGKLLSDSVKADGGDDMAGKNPIVKKKILIIKSSNNTPQLSARNSTFLIDKEVTKKNTRNSFLGRGEETLARLATLTTKNGADTDGTLPAVAVAAKQRNFVFTSITPNTAAEKKNKRKSNDNNVSGGGGDDQDKNTTQIQKKRKTSHENNNNKIKRRLLDILT